jgi:hypothetical protein
MALIIRASKHKEGEMIDREQPTAKGYILCIWQNLLAMKPDDKGFGQNKVKALEYCRLLWDLMGYGGHCKGGDLPSKG